MTPGHTENLDALKLLLEKRIDPWDRLSAILRTNRTIDAFERERGGGEIILPFQ